SLYVDVYRHKATSKSAALGVTDQKNFVNDGIGGYTGIGSFSGALGCVDAVGGAGGVGGNGDI
ncbi:hypothetical protein MKX03_026574, partial [Papaver bracteatum]